MGNNVRSHERQAFSQEIGFITIKNGSLQKLAIQVVCTLIYSEKYKTKKNMKEYGYLLMFCYRSSMTPPPCPVSAFSLAVCL